MGRFSSLKNKATNIGASIGNEVQIKINAIKSFKKIISEDPVLKDISFKDALVKLKTDPKLKKAILKKLVDAVPNVPIEKLLSFIGLEVESSDSEELPNYNDMTLLELKKQNQKRDYAIDTLLVQSGSLKLCHEELVFKKLQHQVTAGRSVEEFNEEERAIYDQQSELLEQQKELEE